MALTTVRMTVSRLSRGLWSPGIKKEGLEMLKFLGIPLALLPVGLVSYSHPAAASLHSRAQTVEVVLGASEFFFDPNRVTAPAGEVKFVIKNKGRYPHGLAFEGGGKSHTIDRISPGQSASLTLRFSDPGRLTFYCPVKGHRERGQEGIAIITSADKSERSGS
jgi:uncharacterized cupredoxin-like copper-binding protein